MRRVDGNPRIRQEKLAAYVRNIIEEAPYDMKELFSRKMEMWEHAGFYPFPYHATPEEITSIRWQPVMSLTIGTNGYARWKQWGGHDTAYRIYIAFSFGIPERIKDDINFIVSAKRV